jgi:hypothetical protein
MNFTTTVRPYKNGGLRALAQLNKLGSGMLMNREVQLRLIRH